MNDLVCVDCRDRMCNEEWHKHIQKCYNRRPLASGTQVIVRIETQRQTNGHIRDIVEPDKTAPSGGRNRGYNETVDRERNGMKDAGRQSDCTAAGRKVYWHYVCLGHRVLREFMQDCVTLANPLLIATTCNRLN